MKTETQTAHTPTPWKATKCTNGDIYIGGHEWAAKLVDKVDFTTMPKEANAAFIVRAVNSHQGLLEMLNLWAHAFEDKPEVTSGKLWQHTKRAISEAGGI